MKFAARAKHSTHTVSLCGALILFLCLLRPTRTRDRGDQASSKLDGSDTRREETVHNQRIPAVALSYERPWCTKGFARGRAMCEIGHIDVASGLLLGLVQVAV